MVTFVAVLLGLVLTVVLHEAGHIYAAHRLGWTTSQRQVLGWRIGSVRILTTSEEILRTRWAVALAGPLMNLAFAFFLLASGLRVGYVLALLNLIVVGINLLPISGSDGLVILRQMRGRV